MTIDADTKAKYIAEWEARQTPVGFYNLALSYLEAADELTTRIHNPTEKERLRLIFDSPVRHLYAQAWELALKACLFAQGTRPRKLKNDFGHRIDKAWKHVDKKHFSVLDLTESTQGIADHLSLYHTDRMFAYPLVGVREYVPLNHIKAESQRFRIPRMDVIRLFTPEASKSQKPTEVA